MTRWPVLFLAAAVACDPAVPEAPPAAPEAPVAAPAGSSVTAPADEHAAQMMHLKELFEEVKAAKDALDHAGARARIQQAMPLAEADPKAMRAFRRLAQEVAVLGAEVPDYTVRSWYTRPANDAKAELLVFWEVWCPHCKRHVPLLEDMQSTWGPKGLEVVGLTRLTRGSSEADARAFIKGTGVTYAVGQLAGNGLADALAVRGVPAAALVKDGVVVWRGHPAVLQDSTLEAVLQ